MFFSPFEIPKLKHYHERADKESSNNQNNQRMLLQCKLKNFYSTLSFQRPRGFDGCFGRASKNELNDCAVVVFEYFPRDCDLTVCYMSLVQHDLSERPTDMAYPDFENWNSRCGLQSDRQKDLFRTYGFLARSEEHTSELQSLRHLVCR